jgi:hypothetical protein
MPYSGSQRGPFLHSRPATARMERVTRVTRRTLMRSYFRFVSVLAASAIYACASGGSSDTEQRPTRPERRDAFVISERELGTSTARNALEAVQKLRPQWLRGRGSGSFGRAPDVVMIYLNDVRLGGPPALAQLMTDGVKEIRYFNAADATSRWGTDHTAGAIVVTMKSGGGD